MRIAACQSGPYGWIQGFRSYQYDGVSRVSQTIKYIQLLIIDTFKGQRSQACILVWWNSVIL